ncbi:MipA/OmpV family protein [Agrobacterium sp. B1(2019)]|uniref:MipA/OmpV family protein n=1 Tax=Agrobacterium sp. B1(2019) TaxID=2607032 RepID=UPI0011ECB53C|nr:MipA/OmpV family protein [Agrobacterium sp. B1(2019)]TZG33500.1 MipA/OmpV family protein [Agrobacterium sp. B1(2019)]
MALRKFVFAQSRAFVAAASVSMIASLSVEVRAADSFEGEESASFAADDFDQDRFGGMRQRLSDWNVIVGVGALYAPKFEGSDEFEVSPVPMISAQIGDRVSIDTTGLTVDLLETNGFTLALTGGYELGRDEDDSSHLRGLGDIDAGGLIGARLSYALGAMEFYASVDRTIGGSDGLLGKFGTTISHQYDRFILSAGASATFADDNHMESYFGVTSAQSIRSGLREYDASAGLKRVDIEASVTYMATENWLIRAQAGVGFLTSDAQNSPIVQDDVQPSALLSVGYKF